MISLHLCSRKKFDSIDELDFEDPKAYKLVIRNFDGIETDYTTVGYVDVHTAITMVDERISFRFEDDDPLKDYRYGSKSEAISVDSETVKDAWKNFVTLKLLSEQSK